MHRTRTTSMTSTISTSSSTMMTTTTTSKSANNSNVENVQVTVRCRPPSKNETNNCWNLWETNKIQSNDPKLKKQHSFSFGKVFA